jgi:hypothetical protein
MHPTARIVHKGALSQFQLQIHLRSERSIVLLFWVISFAEGLMTLEQDRHLATNNLFN